jgi:hypothetical protein
VQQQRFASPQPVAIAERLLLRQLGWTRQSDEMNAKYTLDISLTNHFSCMKLFMENERLKWPFLKQTNKNDHFSLSFCMKSE